MTQVNAILRDTVKNAIKGRVQLLDHSILSNRLIVVFIFASLIALLKQNILQNTKSKTDSARI